MVKGTVETKSRVVTETRKFTKRVLTEEEILEVLREYYALGDEAHTELRYVGKDHGIIPISAHITSMHC